MHARACTCVQEDPVSQTFARNESYAEVTAGKYDALHLFQTWWRPRKSATWVLPKAEPTGEWHGGPMQNGWRSPTNGSVSSFSAACWYFGKALADDPKLSGVPIGLVGTVVGGTFIEQWIRNETQAQCQQTLCGAETPRTTLHAPLCGSLFNGNIAPFINQTITGIIWCKSSRPPCSSGGGGLSDRN
eukprot:SAG11_NODE_1295_length_5275_cov_3.069165_6_plen_187_part_00